MAQIPLAPPSIDEVRAQVSKMLDTLRPEVPVAATVLFQVNPTRELQFLENARLLTEATRRLPGVNVFAFHKGIVTDSSRQYLIYEDWQTRDQFRVQWDSAHLKRFQYTVGELVLAAPDLRFYYGWPEYRQSQPSSSDGAFASSFLNMPWQMSMAGVQMMTKMFDPGTWMKMMSEMGRQVGSDSGSRPCACGHSSPSWKANDEVGRAWPRSAPEARPSTSPPAQAGWGPMPSSSSSSPIAASGNAVPPSFAEPDISPDYPYAAHYAEVRGAKMHYVEAGSGQPILLLHGNPTWSYLWRNVIPHLSSLGRCIAPDLIGYGRSSKPDVRYSWFDHADYLKSFIEALGLEDITLVLHDHGSGLGFHYAMQNPENVKAIAFFEAIVRPFPWDEFSSPQFREIFRKFRTGDVGGEGWQLIVEENMFIEQLLPQAAGRVLSEKEMNFYREPFRQAVNRMPIWRLARETPIGGAPSDVWDAVSTYSQRLQRSNIPKLMLYATPGALLTQMHVEWVQQMWKNLRSVDIGPGIHFLQESSPHRIGREIASWLRNLPPR